MELLLASNNPHKLAEFTRLFPGHAIRMPRETGIDFEYPENGKDFLENALGKARALFSLTARPVIADDSGLCVRALGGEPGIYSSRYGASGGGNLETEERNGYLLSRMKGIGDRRAYFVCCLVLVMEEARFFIAQETVHGTITEAPRGEKGFGYDPLFFLPGMGKTIAELPDADKDRLSHRGRAARGVVSMLEGNA